jgi:hypothetical protein
MKSILDSSFEYTPSSQTDVRKTFARARLERQAQMGREEEPAQISGAAPVTSVTKLIIRRPAQPGAD